MVVYLDVLLAVNWVIDYFLLLLSMRFLQISVRRRRILLGSGLGALTSLTIFLPVALSGVAFAVNLAASVAIVWASFGGNNWRMLLKALFCFYGMSFIFAGIMTALWYFAAPKGLLVKNGVVYYNISPGLFILITFVTYLVLRLAQKITNKRPGISRFAGVTVSVDGNQARLRGIIDTGNSLIESLSGTPVVVVEYEAVRQLFPPLVKNAFDGSGKTIPGEELGWQKRFRMIPFSAVAVKGMLPSFRADWIQVEEDGKNQERKNVYIAVCNQKLSDGQYQALINPDIMEAALAT